MLPYADPLLVFIYGSALLFWVGILVLFVYAMKKSKEKERWQGECWDCNHTWEVEEDGEEIGRLFEGQDLEFIKCPSCGSRELGFNRVSEEEFTWNVALLQDMDEGYYLVGFQFGYGNNPPAFDLSPRYAKRMAKSLNECAKKAEEKNKDV